MHSHGDLPSELTLHVPVAYIYGRFYVGYHCASRLNAWASVGTMVTAKLKMFLSVEITLFLLTDISSGIQL